MICVINYRVCMVLLWVIFGGLILNGADSFEDIFVDDGSPAVHEKALFDPEDLMCSEVFPPLPFETLPCLDDEDGDCEHEPGASRALNGALCRESDLLQDACTGSSLAQATESDGKDDSLWAEEDVFEVDQSEDSRRLPALRALLERGKIVKFEDVSEGLYAHLSKQRFLRDILQLMHRGVEVREEDDGLRYLGVVNVEDCCPVDPLVSEAMMHLLNAGCVQNFCLKFRLYRQGYKKYTPGFLSDLESAFVVGGVHPCRRKFIQRPGVTALKDLQIFWRDCCDYSRAAYQKSLRSQLIHRRHRGALWRLWDLRQSGELITLKALMRRDDAGALQVQSPAKVTCVSQPQKQRQPKKKAMYFFERCMIDFLKERCGREVPIAEVTQLMEEVSCRKVNLRLFLKHLLTLVLDGWAIDYDKDRGVMTYLGDVALPRVLEEGTNVVTMMYDLLCTHGVQICVEELAYYAYIKGHWLGDDLNDFCKTLEQYRRFLVILEKVEVGAFGFGSKKDVKRQISLWRAGGGSRQREGVDYRALDIAGVTDEDVAILPLVKKFCESEEYRLLTLYIAAEESAFSGMSHEEYIRSVVSQRPRTEKSLWSLCRKRKIHGKNMFFSILGKLALRAEAGHLMYDLAKGMFYWDRRVRCVPVQNEDVTLTIFHLQCSHPDMTSLMITHILKQYGYQRILHHDVSLTLCCFEMLGLCDTQRGDDYFVTPRSLANALVSGMSPGQPIARFQRDANGKIPLFLQMPERVALWVKEGVLVKLWRAYEASTALAGESYGMPRAKRVKRDRIMDASATILQYMPSIYDVLFENECVTAQRQS